MFYFKLKTILVVSLIAILASCSKDSGSSKRANFADNNNKQTSSNSGNNQTGNDQTGNDQTGNDQTGNDQTGNNQTGNNQTGNDQTGNDQTGNDQTGNDQTGNQAQQQRQEQLSYHIAKGNDDAQQNLSDGVVVLGGDALALGDNNKSLIGLRFNDIAILKNTPIVSAYIQFSAAKNNSAQARNNIQINIEDAANAAKFSTSNKNLSNRKRLPTNVIWQINSSWKDTVNERSNKQRSPNLAHLIQAIVNKQDWKSGNSISFLLEGNGLHNAISYEGSHKALKVNDLAANLVITLPSWQQFTPSAGHDDAEENLKTGKVTTNSKDLELGFKSADPQSAQIVGIRFNNINITPKSKIHRAYIQFTQDEDKNNNPFKVTISGENSANPKAFSNANKNLSSRKKTSNSALWQSTKKWSILNEAGTEQRTVDLSHIVQELVDNPRWETGNSMAFFIEGSGTRTAESFEAGINNAAKLVVEYTNASAPIIFDKIRLVWNKDPATTMSIIWHKNTGDNGQVLYNEYTRGDCPTKPDQYQHQQQPQRSNSHYGMHTVIARLTDLKPNTDYRFIIKNDQGVSQCSWFRTAPNTPQAFSYITGGDTKSSGKALIVGRWSNQMVSKIRPLFVVFTGDFNSGLGTDSNSWQQWLNDWSTLTRSKDGRMYPLIAVHGNHENGDFQVLYKLFDTGNNNPKERDHVAYNAYSFGGNLLYLMNLNSELHRAVLQPIWRSGKSEKQIEWMKSTLSQAQHHLLKVVAYHKPMRPHTKSKSEEYGLSEKWAPIMEQYGVDLAYESDTHNHKITYPIRLAKSGEEASEGFIRDDDNGIVYVGEGSWGALPRVTDDDKSWTLNSAAINQIKLNRVYPATANGRARIDINVIKIAQINDNGQLVNFSAGVRERDYDQPLGLPFGVSLQPILGNKTTLSIPFKQ